MTDVFISYSRKDIAFARLLHQALAENELETWIDWQDIPPSADWLAEVYEAIEGADAFVFVISKDSVESEICSQELIYAYENSKRLIPILIDQIEPSSVPPFVAVLNWIFFREEDDFDTSMKLLLDAIYTDQVWVKDHTRYQIRALEWDRSDCRGAYLLHGADIEVAENWLTKMEGKDPAPTELQRVFIIASRGARTRSQRLVFGGLTGTLILTLGLSAFAFLQRGVAVEQLDLQSTAESRAVGEAQIRATAEGIAVMERDARATAVAESQFQRDIALSQYLAAESLNLSSEQLDLKLLLSVAASRFHFGVEARSSLLEAILAEDNFQVIVMQDTDFMIRSIALNADGTHLAVGSERGEIRVLDPQTGKVLFNYLADEDSDVIEQLTFSGDCSTLISVNVHGNTFRWDLTLDEPQSILLSALDHWVRFLAINYDGSEVAALTTSGNVAILDPNTGEILQRLERSNRFNDPMIFSPDGKKIAAFDQKNKIYIWDRESGERNSLYVNLPEGSSDPVQLPPLNEQYTLAFHPEGEGLIFGTGHVTYYWDFSPEKIPGTDPAYSIGFNADNLPVAFSVSDEGPYQWEILSGEINGSPTEIGFGGDTSRAEELGYIWNPLTEDCFYVWVSSSGSSLIVRYGMYDWDPITWTIVDSENYKSIVHVPQSDTNLMIAAGCHEPSRNFDCNRGLVQFWGGEDWDPEGDPILAHQDWISSVAISLDGSFFATASEDNTVQIWDYDSRTPRGGPVFLDFIGIDSRLSFHPSGEFIALYDGWERIYFLDVDKNSLIGEPFTDGIIGEMEAVRDFAFSPNGSRMAVIHVGDALKEEIETEGPYDLYKGYVLSPEGKYLTVIHEKAALAMWDISSPTEPVLIYRVDLKDTTSGLGLLGWGSVKDTYPVAFHPEGDKLAVGFKGSAVLIDAETGEILFSQPGNQILTSESSDIAFSPDGQWIAIANTTGEIQLYDGNTGIEVGLSFVRSGLTQDAITFSPNSEDLFSVFFDGRIYRWDISQATWLDLACKANRNLSQEEWQSYLGDVDPREICPDVP